ncbi:MAG: serine/threonine protein kinase, partial [Burkholderiales bacterium]
MGLKTLGRYRILGELGRGAMGVVYRAVDPVIEREVALKTLHADLPDDVAGEVRVRFLREARSAG